MILSDPNHQSNFPADEHFLILCYYGNSLYEECTYGRAQEILKEALIDLKHFETVKHKLSTLDPGVDYFNEVEIQYKLALCYKATKQISEAIATLQNIPAKNRISKVNMLMFKLMQLNGQHYDKSGILPLKLLLKECPLNLEAIAGLLKLGVKPIELHLWIGDDLPPPIKDWLNHFIDGRSKMQHCQFAAAIESLKAIESNNEMILVLIGQCYYYMGNADTAETYLSRAYQINNHLNEGLMTLAAVYGTLNRLSDLEKLTPKHMGFDESKPEYWFVLAQYLYLLGKYEKALYFSQKAFNLRPQNTEAAILKVRVFIQIKKYKEALTVLRSVEEVCLSRNC